MSSSQFIPVFIRFSLKYLKPFPCFSFWAHHTTCTLWYNTQPPHHLNKYDHLYKIPSLDVFVHFEIDDLPLFNISIVLLLKFYNLLCYTVHTWAYIKCLLHKTTIILSWDPIISPSVELLKLSFCFRDELSTAPQPRIVMIQVWTLENSCVL